MKWLYKKQKKIFLGLAVFITFSVVVGSLGLDFVARSPLDAAILVDGRKITKKRFDTLYQNVLEQNRDNPQLQQEAAREYLKRQIVQSLIQEEVFLREAERYSVRVTDAELAQFIQAAAPFQKDGAFDPAAYQRFLNQIRMRAADFEEEQRRQMKVRKAQDLMVSGVKISSLEWPELQKRAMETASAEERKKFAEDPAAFRDNLRGREIQASLQEWYTALNTQLRVKVLIDQDRNAKTPTPATPPADPAAPPAPEPAPKAG